MKPLFAFLLLTLLQLSVRAQNTTDTRMLHSPAVSASKIAFVYAEDLWVADKSGANPRRLTIDEGVESNPVFSPDGSWIAFSAEYDGNTDVFVVPAAGGVPRRLTWHPSWDVVRGFSPDGRSVLFNSRRTNYTNRHAKIYTVSIDGGPPEELPLPTAYDAAISPDGKFIAYTPLFEAHNQWKNYRGGRQSRIWIYDRSSHAVTEIPKPAGGGNDTNPQWLGNQVVFRSDRDGEFNLYRYDPLGRTTTQLTHFEDFPVLHQCSNGGEIVIEQAGYLHLLDPGTGSVRKLTIGIATDLLELRSRYVTGGAQYIRSDGISPSGARAVFDFRGDIVTVPAEKGDPRNITQSPGAHETFPAWSPDGGTIAYFSDASGEYALKLQSVVTGDVRTIPLEGHGFYAFIHWAPDSKMLCFSDNSRTLYILDTGSGKITAIASDVLYSPGAYRDLFGSWSHDSKWVAYTRISETNFERAYAYSLGQKKSFPVSDGLSNVTEPTFDPSGKYLYMLASTDAGPVVNWFDQSNQDMEMEQAIYLVTLQNDLPSPLAKENDQEEPASAADAASKNSDPDSSKNGDDSPAPLDIDWDGIETRVISLPLSPGLYSSLSAPAEGKLYYLSNKPHGGFSTPASLMTFDLEARESKEVAEAQGYEIASGGKKMLIRGRNTWHIADVGAKPENGPLNIGAISVRVEPRAEWKNIYEEAWRVNRDYFYDPNMHGLDWEGARKKYEPFLDDVVCSADLYQVLEWLFSELSVGHHYQSSGDRLRTAEHLNTGLLGADYETANDRYRISKIYGGLNWTPDLRSPLTEPGVNVSVGDYLLEVDGEPVTASDNLYSFFENKADRIITLKVGPNTNGSGARVVKVVPVANEQGLRNRDWIEGNIRKVDVATDGQVAYVYVPNTTTAGHEYFKRYFFPQVNKKAVIIDERYNGGGQLADYYIDILKRPYQSSWKFRYGNDLIAPSGSIQGPKVMIIDETAGSGGDYLPWMFRKYGLGKLIGKTTWGGLVGILGFPEFIDGGSVTAPNLAFYDETGYTIENEGIAPDIDVEQWPAEVMEGKDPQLEKAIEVILEELKANPPVYPPRPEYPVRVRASQNN